MADQCYHIIDDSDVSTYAKLIELYNGGWVDDPKRNSKGTESKRLYPLIKYTEQELAEMADAGHPSKVEEGPIEEMYEFSIAKDSIINYDPSLEVEVLDPLNMALRNGFSVHKEYSGKATLVRRGELGRRVNLKHFTRYFISEADKRAEYEAHFTEKIMNANAELVNMNIEPLSPTSLEACRLEVLKIWGIHVSIKELEHYVK